MKAVARAVLLVGLVILMLGASRGQVPAATSTAAAVANVSGRWVGAFDIVHPDGAVDPTRAIFQLKQEGGTLTGTAGPAEDKMSPISQGTVQGQDVHFVLTLPDGAQVQFALKLEDGRLRGTATKPNDANSHATVNVARWPEGGPEPEAVHAK